MKIQHILITLLFITGTAAAQQNISFNEIETLYKNNKFTQILQIDIDQTINAHPADTAAILYYYLSRAHVSQGQYSRAIDLYEQKISNNTSPAGDFYLRSRQLYAYSLYQAGRLTEAAENYKFIQQNLSDTDNPLVKYQAYLNASLVEWDAGRFEKYRLFTEKALKHALEANDKPRQSLVYSNLSEYYELIENWPAAIMYIDKASGLVNRQTNINKWAWLSIRKASIEASKNKNYQKAITQLKKVQAATDSASIYQYWEKSTYELVSVYFKTKEYMAAEDELIKLTNNPAIQQNTNDFYKARARLVQLHTLTGSIGKAQQLVGWLEVEESKVSDLNSLILGLHARAMLAHATDQDSKTTALAERMFMLISDEVTAVGGKNIVARLSQIYQTARLDNQDRAHINALVRKKAVKNYISDIENIDWVYQSRPSALFRAILTGMIVLLISTLVISYFRNKKQISYARMVQKISG